MAAAGVLSIDGLASAVGMEPAGLVELAGAASDLFEERKPQRKRDGTLRRVFKPSEPLLGAHQALARLVREMLPPSTVVYSDPVEAVRDHCGKPYVITGDVIGCYPAMRQREVESALRRLGVAPGVADLIGKLSTRSGRLVQGSPLSPELAELVLREIDAELPGRWSRFADDWVTSGPDAVQLKRHGEELVRLARARHLSVRLRGPRPHYHAQQALGLNLNKPAAPCIPPEKRQAIRRRIRQTLTDAQGRELTDTERRRIAGLINWVRRLHPNDANSLDRMVEKIRSETS